MKNWIKIAFRNIIKNRRRSMITILAIGIGFSAICLFRGYISSIDEGLRNSAICGEGLAHLTIYKKGWLENGKIDPANYLFSKEEYTRIIQILTKLDNVRLSTPQLTITGIASNGNNSTIFIADGVVAKDDEQIRKGVNPQQLSEKNNSLHSSNNHEGIVSEDLSRYLNLKKGDYVILMSTTLEGQMNAMDLDITGIYNTGSKATNDKFIRLPFNFAQSLYDTNGADKILVLLNDWKDTWKVKSEILQLLTNYGISCEVQTWCERSVMYAQVKKMFQVIFIFIFIIVLFIVIMSTINTMAMSVIERTREIGTIRAFGVKQRKVVTMFSIEGAIIGLLGALVGTVIYISACGLIQYIHPTYTPPGVSTPVPLIVHILPGAIFQFTCFMVLLSFLSAIIPARYASKQSIIDALGHI